MNNVTVSKDDLLKTLKDNREKHVQIYKDALEGARAQYKTLLEAEIKKLDDGEQTSLYVNAPEPKNYEDLYTEVIEMLEMSVEDEVTLTRHEFQNYVQDKWVSDHDKSILRAYALSSSNAVNYK